jgi:hypothetical protein
VISSSQKPLPDKAQYSQQTNFHAPVSFEPTISAGERPQTYDLDRAAAGTGGNTQLQGQNYQFALKKVWSVTANLSNRYTKMYTIFLSTSTEASEGFLQIHLNLELG